jgi:hypothetical protein
MRVALVAVAIATLLAGCGSSIKTVDYDWSNTSGSVRQAAIAAGQQQCTRNPSTPASGAEFDPNNYGPDQTCVNNKASARFDATLGRLRAQALGKVCASTGADRVRITWIDYSTDRVTETIGCGQIPKTIERKS